MDWPIMAVRIWATKMCKHDVFVQHFQLQLYLVQRRCCMRYMYNVEQFSTVYETTLYETTLYKVLLYKRFANTWIHTTLAFNVVWTQLRTTLAANIVWINCVRCNINTVIPHIMLYESNSVWSNVVWIIFRVICIMSSILHEVPL